MCGWCCIDAAVVTLYHTPTCTYCAGSRARRIAAYHERLKRAAKESK